MIATPLKCLRHLARRFLAATRTPAARWTLPAPLAIAVGAAADATRSRSALLLENALLRHQLVVLSRSVKRPRLTAADRGLLVLLAGRLRAWAGALVIVRPETVLRWHRAGFRLFWRRKSRPRSAPKPKVAAEAVALIREMAVANRLWGADRIRGELVKLDIRVSKRTIQRYLRQARPPDRSGQAWSTFLRNHAGEVWACNFLPVSDLLFRPLYAFVVIALGSRRVVHVGVIPNARDYCRIASWSCAAVLCADSQNAALFTSIRYNPPAPPRRAGGRQDRRAGGARGCGRLSAGRGRSGRTTEMGEARPVLLQLRGQASAEARAASFEVRQGVYVLVAATGHPRRRMPGSCVPTQTQQNLMH